MGHLLWCLQLLCLLRARWTNFNSHPKFPTLNDMLFILCIYFKKILFLAIRRIFLQLVCQLIHLIPFNLHCSSKIVQAAYSLRVLFMSLHNVVMQRHVFCIYMYL